EILTDFAGPEVAVRCVEAELPALANAVGPDFRANAFLGGEGIVRRNGAAVVRRHFIDIEAEYLAGDHFDVVAAVRPGDDLLGALPVGGECGAVDGVADDAAAVRLFLRAIRYFRQEDEAVLRELRMEREAIDRVLHIEDEFLLRPPGGGVYQVYFARPFGDAPGFSPRNSGDFQRLV